MRHALRTDDRHQSGVDLLDGGEDEIRRGPASLGERQKDAPPVLRVHRTVDVAAYDEGVDQLADGLLGHTEIGDDVTERRAFRFEESKYVTAVGWHVAAPRLGECVADEQAIDAAAWSQQQRQHSVRSEPWVGFHGADNGPFY